jgi:hypothetical protein
MAFVLVAAVAPPAHAYDPATTHAGLTQQAALASSLHLVLVRRLARPLGLYDPVALHPEVVSEAARRLLLARLGALDPAGGYRPGGDWKAPALAWLTAGAVIAKTPPERVQNLFFDPSTGAGLRDDAAIDGFLHSVRVSVDRGGLRGLTTGSSFSLEGKPALEWLEAPENDVGLAAFHQLLEAAVAAPDPATRASSLARALLAAGGVLAVLEDLGNPAQVRNDFRGTYLRGRSGSPFDRASGYERYVAEAYGTSGVPAPRGVVRRPDLRAFFTAADGEGLADRTQRRFFSDGTLPEDAIVDRETSTRDVLVAARASLPYASPTLGALDLREMGRRRHVVVTDEGGTKRRLLAYQRVPGRVRFFLDAGVHADAARVLLPEIGGYAAGLLDHLFRGEVRLTVEERQRFRAVVASPRGPVRGGSLRIFAEDAAGRRRDLASPPPAPASGGGGDDVVMVAAIPPGTRRLAAVYRGTDAAGALVAVGELALPPEKAAARR